MEEIWKDIEGYEGLYQVSNIGNVRSFESDKFHKGRLLKPYKMKNGYLQVCLYSRGTKKKYLVHRLVAKAFIANICLFEQVNHIDEDKENNCVSNLEWCDSKYNINYGSHNYKVSTSNSKKVLCIETGIVYNSTRHAERMLGIKHENISSCCNGKYKQTGGYHWIYT